MRNLILGALVGLGATAMLYSCSTAVSKPHHQPAAAQPGTQDEDPKPGERSQAITWQVTADHSSILRDANNDTYLYLSLRGGESAKSRDRKPLNISLVLDRSGSMAGDKIQYAKRAAKFVIDQLDGQDILSIVNYDNVVEVTSPSAPVQNKELLKDKVERLSHRGGTNLSGGMLEGYTQVSSAIRSGYINRVLLLTDGLANEGITDPSRLKEIVSNKFRSQGIALSTFGLGAGYNEDLLTGMAEAGGANYYFIEKADQIAQIFSKELKGLLSVVAQNTVLTVDLPRGYHCSKVYGYDWEEGASKVSIRLNDIYARDEKGILIKLSGTPASGNVMFDCALRYTDALNGQDYTDHKSITLKTTDSRTEYVRGEDKGVTEMIALFQSADDFDQIMAATDKGDYEEARKYADSTIIRLKVQQQLTPSKKLEEQEKRLSGYAQGISKMSTMQVETRSNFQKSNKMMNYELKKSKR